MLRDLADPAGFTAGLGAMYAAVLELFDLPAGATAPVVLAYEPGDWGAMWARTAGPHGQWIGVPRATWPNLVAAANRRLAVSALVHELGHLAFWWDWEPASGRSYMAWGGAVEGFATPVGTYACRRLDLVPSWIDHPDGTRDWATLQDWANELIRQGLDARRAGGRGQDGVGRPGHGPGAAITEAVLFDLVFNHFGYEPLHRVLAAAFAEGRTPAAAARTDEAKMADFFIALGRAAGRDLSAYLAAWGFEASAIADACAGLQPLEAGLPRPAPVAYA